MKQRKFWYRCGYATGLVACAFVYGLLYVARLPSDKAKPQIRLRVVK